MTTKEGGLRGSIRNVGVGLGIPDSGVSRWTFDDADTSGSTATDVWDGNDGTINGATTSQPSLTDYDSNESYSFDGTDDYVEVNTSALDGLSSFSFSCWANYTGSAKGWVVSEINELGNFGILNNTNGNELRVYNNGTQVRPSGQLTSTAEHLVVTYDGSQMEVYRDGTSAGTASESGAVSNPSGYYFGARSGLTEHHEGGIDDPRFYDKSLTSTEVSNLYQTGSING